MHSRPPIEFKTGDSHRWTVILAHGRGASPDSMKRFAERLNLPARYLLLEASDHAWYPNGFMAPIDRNEPHLSAALAAVEHVVSETLAQRPSSEVIVGGFSQGACLVAEWLARHPRRIGGLLALTGGLIGPEGTTWEAAPSLAGMRAYVSSAEDDSWIPPSRTHETVEWLERSGADVTLQMFESREHTISDLEVEQIQALLS